jgi:hypothetical protein
MGSTVPHFNQGIKYEYQFSILFISLKTKIMKTKKTFLKVLLLIVIATGISFLTSCKKDENPDQNTNQPAGIWSGTLRTNDPAVGHWVEYTLTIDFDKLTGTSTCYGNGQIVGHVKKVSSSTIEVDWPQCNYETVTYSLNSNTLTASGSQKAYSDGRTAVSEWVLTKTSEILLSGVWEGTLKTNDPAVGYWVEYTLTIDFDNLTGSSTCYGNGEIVGHVKNVSSTTIEVDWPECNYETVTYTLNNNTLRASGSQKAYSDGRTATCEWVLTKTIENQLSGVWSGTLKTNDPAVGYWVEYILTIDFDNLTGTSTCYGNGQIVGHIESVSSSTIEVDWPLCNYETVTYSLNNNTLSASGSQKAYSDGRTTPSEWVLTKQ